MEIILRSSKPKFLWFSRFPFPDLLDQAVHGDFISILQCGVCVHACAHGKLGEKHNDTTQAQNKEACYGAEVPVSEDGA